MLPALYHCHHREEVEDIPFWVDVAGDLSQPVLELGCGTGRVLIPLAQQGHPVTGIDHDAGMLTYLQKQLDIELKSYVRLIQADMAHFRLARHFPNIFMPCNTLSTLSSETRQATFFNVKHHLAKDGIFVASLPNPQALLDLPRHGREEIEMTFVHPVSGNPVQVLSAWERTKQSFTITWSYDHLYPDGIVERISIPVQYSLAPLEIYEQELHHAGLTIRSIFGDFNRAVYRADTPYLILVAG